jgi:hypothetical protein
VLCALRGRAGLADFAELTPSGGTAPSYPSKTVPRQPTNARRSRPCPSLSHHKNPAAIAVRIGGPSRAMRAAAGEAQDRGASLASGPASGSTVCSADGGIADTTRQ